MILSILNYYISEKLGQINECRDIMTMRSLVSIFVDEILAGDNFYYKLPDSREEIHAFVNMSMLYYKIYFIYHPLIRFGSNSINFTIFF